MPTQDLITFENKNYTISLQIKTQIKMPVSLHEGWFAHWYVQKGRKTKVWLSLSVRHSQTSIFEKHFIFLVKYMIRSIFWLLFIP